MTTPLAGHTNSYHTYSFDEALQGIAESGYRGVELSAVPGWTEHVNLDVGRDEVRRRLDHYGLTAVSLSGHSDLTTRDGLAHGISRATRLLERDQDPAGFEGLLGTVEQLMDPLDPFAAAEERFRSLRRKPRREH